MDSYVIYDKYGQEVENPFRQSSQGCQGCFEKQRKLTSDSGYGDEMLERRDSVFGDCDNTNTSLKSILENVCQTSQNKYKFEMNEFPKAFEKLKLGDGRKCFSLDEQHIKAQRKRRVTPVPKDVNKSKPSKGSFGSGSDTPGGEKTSFLFVEEEDEDDVEQYNSEDDYICPDILSCKRYTEKRNSWHGRTEEELKQGLRKKEVTLQKSKSLDREKSTAARKRRRFMMSRSSLAPTSTNLLDPHLERNVGAKTTCYPFKNMDKPWTKENINMCEIQVSIDSDVACRQSNSSALPLWMKEAEAELNSSDASSEDETNDDILSKKLQIPSVNWEKLNEEKNKTNQILSNQRKQKNKEKNEKIRHENRRRKLTPSESPSASSLEKLSTLKSSIDQWTLVEEEDEENEIEE